MWMHLTEEEILKIRELTQKTIERNDITTFNIKETQLYKTLSKEVTLLEILLFQCMQGTTIAEATHCENKDFYEDYMQKKMALLYLNSAQLSHESIVAQTRPYLK